MYCSGTETTDIKNGRDINSSTVRKPCGECLLSPSECAVNKSTTEKISYDYETITAH